MVWIWYLIAFVVTAIVILFLRRKLRKKDKKEDYLKKLDKINLEKENALEEITKLSKEFFHKKLGIKNESFYEIEEELLKRKLNSYAKYCHELGEIFYEGKEINKKTEEKIIKELKKIITEVERKDKPKKVKDKLKLEEENIKKDIKRLRHKSKIKTR